MVTFSNWVAKSGQSHEQVARRMGCSRAYVSYLIHGQKTPSLEMLRRMLLVSNGSLKAEDLILEFTIGV